MKLEKSFKVIFFGILIIAGSFILAAGDSASDLANQALFIELTDDTINPVTAEYIINAIDTAVKENAACLVIKMDTPGGLLSSTREIVKHILTADVPIVVYISPSGSRAGSAGVFITYASHIAAMAPTTNIGAAHPVQMGGGSTPPKKNDWQELRDLIDDLRKEKVDETDEEAGSKDSAGNGEWAQDENPMESKILNDTLAFIRSIAKKRNRNVEWAVESVVKSASITEEEALEKGVIEIIAKSDRDLLDQINGRIVSVNGKDITLATQNIPIEYVKMDTRQQFFNILANPNIAYFLLILGFYGLLFEVTHPGIGFPGIIGAIFLILAFYSMQTLPTNYAGLALLVLGLVLLIAEAYTPVFGLLTLGGIVCLVLGSMLLFESADPVMRVSRAAIFSFSLTTAAVTLFLLRLGLRTHQMKKISGQEGLIGEKGEAQSDFQYGKGKVYVHGEIWNAMSDEKIKKGEEVNIISVTGLNVKVEKPKKEEGS